MPKIPNSGLLYVVVGNLKAISIQHSALDVLPQQSNHQRDISPISAYHESVVNTFAQNKEPTQFATYILALIYALGGDEVPEAFFDHLWEARYCWDTNGEPEKRLCRVYKRDVSASEIKDRFRDCIRDLEHNGLIQSADGPCGKRKFQLGTCDVSKLLDEGVDLAQVRWLALVLVCQTFPGRFEGLA